VFCAYVVAAAVLTPVYGMIPTWAGASSDRLLLILGPVIGFCGAGYFSLFGALLAELYPTAIRGSAQGFAYNFGRAASAEQSRTAGGSASPSD
jgi:hypothetical protein